MLGVAASHTLLQTSPTQSTALPTMLGHFPSVCKVNIASLTLSRRAQLPAQGLGPETTCSGHWWDAPLPTLPPHTQPSLGYPPREERQG